MKESRFSDFRHKIKDISSRNLDKLKQFLDRNEIKFIVPVMNVVAFKTSIDYEKAIKYLNYLRIGITEKYVRFFENTDLRTAQEIEDWVNSLTISKRKPRNISKVEHEVMLGFKNILEDPMYRQDKNFRDALIKQKYTHLRLPKEEYERVYGSMESEPEIVKGKYATYKKSDVGSYKRFQDNITNIEQFFGTLKGYHRIPLQNLTVEFVSAKDMKVPAKYRTGRKLIWINPLSKKVGNTLEEYGSLRYIVLHELGHKFLEHKSQSWNIGDSSLYTTKYSTTNPMTMNEEEAFAELFALSHWKKKYPEYSRQIAEFERRLET